MSDPDFDTRDAVQAAVASARPAGTGEGTLSSVHRRGIRRRRVRAVGGTTAMLAVLAVAALAVSGLAGRSDRPDELASGGPAATATSPEGPGVGGVLPTGDSYRVESASLDDTVTGISAAIVLDDGAASARAIGIVTFQRVEAGAQSFADDDAGVVGVVSGEWMLHISIYDEVWGELGDDAATLVASWIDPSDPAHGSGLPSFELSAPLRWADDEELPLQMQVGYAEFVVRRGCGPTAEACSDDRSLQVIAAEGVVDPAPSWPGGTVRITND